MQTLVVANPISQTEFRDYLIELFKTKTISRMEVAELFGVSIGTVSHWIGNISKQWCRVKNIEPYFAKIEDYLEKKHSGTLTLVPKPTYSIDNGTVAKVDVQNPVDDCLFLLIDKRMKIVTRMDEIKVELDGLQKEDSKLEIAINALREINGKENNNYAT